MIPEVEVLLHVDDVVQIVFVFLLYDLQDLQFNKSLVVKPARTVKKKRFLKAFVYPLHSMKCLLHDY